MKTFDIKVYDCYDVTFRLAVCKTRKEMLAAIVKHSDKEVYENNPPCPNTMAMFVPTISIIRGKEPGEFFSTVFGTMYLNLADVDDEIITHECGHAAFAWEFYIRHYTGKFDDDSFDEQEEYCYFLGKAAAEVRKIIKSNFKGIQV
jgi:hypothetical protein